jgi:hypothetical protein
VQFDWKAIPASLTYEILNSTNLVSYAENRVSDFFENDSPPDYCEGFTERKFQYAKLGLKAAELAARLRKKMALPERDVADWDPLEHLVKVKMKIESDRKERDNRHAESIGSIRLHGANSTGDLPRPTLEEMST